MSKADSEYEKERIKYGETLLQSMQESQDQYDKSIISLSSGALGISFAFIDKLIDLPHAHVKVLLLMAWIFWAGDLFHPGLILCQSTSLGVGLQ